MKKWTAQVFCGTTNPSLGDKSYPDLLVSRACYWHTPTRSPRSPSNYRWSTVTPISELVVSIITYGFVWKCWLNPEKPNGFADQTIPFLNGYFIGGLDPIFRHTHITTLLWRDRIWWATNPLCERAALWTHPAALCRANLFSSMLNKVDSFCQGNYVLPWLAMHLANWICYKHIQK